MANREPTQQEWAHYAKSSPILAGMIRDRKPLTRAQYLKRAYVFDGVPDPVPPEVEATLPPPFRKAFDED